jgi:hypothetical protein
MIRRIHLGLLIVLAFVPPSGAATASTLERFGDWVISCPGQAPCTMRADKRFLDKSGVTGDLEIQAQGNILVPVLTLHGLPGEALIAAALMGKTEATLQFHDGPPYALDCAVSPAGYICAPNETTGPKLAAALPAARHVTVRVTVAVTGMTPLPPQERSLDLSGTVPALTRYRAEGPTPVPGRATALASQSPAGLTGIADRALKAAGYPNGLADLQARLSKYMRK